MLDMDALKEFAEIENKLVELKLQMDGLETRKTELNPYIVQNLIDNQIDRITVNGRTIYTHRRVVINVLSDRQKAIEALKKSGFGDYVKEDFNTRSVNALLSEMVNNDVPFPEEFEGCIDYHSIVNARSRNSTNP